MNSNKLHYRNCDLDGRKMKDLKAAKKKIKKSPENNLVARSAYIVLENMENQTSCKYFSN